MIEGLTKVHTCRYKQSVVCFLKKLCFPLKLEGKNVFNAGSKDNKEFVFSSYFLYFYLISNFFMVKLLITVESVQKDSSM